MWSHAYPLVSQQSGCFFSMGQSSTAARHVDITGSSCHMHVQLILGLMRASLEDHRGERCAPPHGCLNSRLRCNADQCMQGDMHVDYVHTHIHTCVSFSLPLSLSLIHLPFGEWALSACKLVGAIRILHSVRQEL